MFIVLEGIDGSGKSTQVKLLSKFLAKDGYPCVLTREPGGTSFAESLRSMILHDPIDPMARLLLIVSARVDHYNKVILPALKEGKVVVCDRFIYSTLAYQGYGDKIDLQTILDLHRLSGCLVEPDLTLLLLGSGHKKLGRDNFERMPREYLSNVCMGYEKIARMYPNIHVIKCMGVGRTSEEIVKIVQGKISEKQTSSCR
ncbi:dTMP kinase [Neorickettsia sennetsu]|uniref:Thymidylate kinase n=1 Tax=Ehrlichia sennetsu (strain ATCC VR-367 / Miyayama) TaxID=222891 RepID=KTHY_EHRS3|nr:dTMP kinase [Neorickettsia sennetsu]Q2GDL6.1 RecName: Full=Thymidylate kinase; AltName: Full=dTMP kinase [Neorickettsia sennetsu str. Miyayama]ABD46241.1 thymidylate kinase [Neorickettsia sennetsu str. Miyayama]